jgi:MYXO-CTERM domain-containing protein
MKTLFSSLAALVAFSAISQATVISGVARIQFSDNDLGPSNGDWFYIEELQVFNVSGVDVASQAFGTTQSQNFAPQFGSTAVGAIDDVIANCCGTGTHSAGPDSSAMFISITLPSVQDIDAMNFPIEIHNRQDGCCPERSEYLNISFYDAADNPITIIDHNGAEGTFYELNGPASFTSTFGPGGGAIAINGVPEPGVALLGLLGVMGLVARRKR